MKKREQFHISLLVESAKKSDEDLHHDTWFSLSLLLEIDCIRNFYANMRSEMEDF